MKCGFYGTLWFLVSGWLGFATIFRGETLIWSQPQIKMIWAHSHKMEKIKENKIQ